MGTEYTITAGQRRKQYTVGGSNQQGPYSFPFEVLTTSDVTVYVNDTKKTLTTHYTVAIASNNTCTITFVAGQYPSQNDVVTIHGGKAVGRTTNFTTAGQLTAAGLNAELGRDVIYHQQVDERVDRCLQLKPSVVRDTSSTGAGPVQMEYDATASNNANKTLTWDANGTAIVNSDFTAGTMATQSASSVNIDGGAIDGTTIGAASAAAGTFTTATATTKVVTPEVEASSGSSLTLDAGGQDLTATSGATMSFGSPTYDVNATSVCTIDNTNTTNGVKIGTTVSGGKVYLGHTTSETTVNDNLTVTGDLIVNGTTTTVNSTTITVDDKNLEIGSVASPSDSTADGGGITLKGATDKTLLWDNANDNWTSNQHLNISTGKEFKINNTKVLDATSLGSGVVGSSLTSTGTLTSLTVSGATALNGNVTLGDAAADTITVGGTLQTATPLVFEGGTSNSHETTLGITDPTADRTITLPDNTGTVLTTGATVAVNNGGTGQTSYTNGQLLIGNTSGNTLAKGTLTAGTGIQVDNAGGSITITNVGNTAQSNMGGGELVLDADGDTSITADTDDQIDVKISGADDFQFTANTFAALSGSTIKADTIAETTSTSGVTIDGVLLKDGVLGANTVDSDAYVDGSIDSAHIGNDQIDSQHYAAGSIDLEHMSSQSVDEDNLHISNAGSNGQFLSKQSGNAGGLTWATPVQIVYVLNGTAATGTTVMGVDNTTPQITEGDEYYSLAITPASSSNILEITCQLQIENTGGARLLSAALFNTDFHATNAMAAAADYAPTGGRMHRLVFTHVMTAPSGSSTTFKLRAGAETSGTTGINKHNTGAFYNGLMRSGIIIKEYAA